LSFEADAASGCRIGQQQRQLDFVVIAMSQRADERLLRMILVLKSEDVPAALYSDMMEITSV
jgi:hypothetical protein